MAYTRTTWSNNGTPGINAGNLNNIEQGIYEAAPAGKVDYFAMSTAPDGYLKANGAAVSVSTYSNLATAIYCGNANNATALFGYKCTDPNDATNTRSTSGAYIVLPDLRGEFIRGYDDSRGIDTARVFGSWQDDAFESHKHIDGIQVWHGSTGNAMFTYGYTHVNGLSGSAATTSNSYNHTQIDNGYTSDTGGTETRPRNVALLACIKY